MARIFWRLGATSGLMVFTLAMINFIQLVGEVCIGGYVDVLLMVSGGWMLLYCYDK